MLNSIEIVISEDVKKDCACHNCSKSNFTPVKIFCKSFICILFFDIDLQKNSSNGIRYIFNQLNYLTLMHPESVRRAMKLAQIIGLADGR